MVVTYSGAHVRAPWRAPACATRGLPPRRDGRRRGRHGRGRGRPRDPLRRRARHRREVAVPQRRGPARQPPHGAARAADEDRRPRGQHGRDALRPEPHQRPAEPDLAQHGQVDRGDRGLPLLPARRPRPEGHAPRPGHQPGQRRLGAGWLVDHPADGQDDAARPGQERQGAQGGHGRHLRPQDHRAALRDRLRAELLQGLDPRALPQHRLLRRRRVRRPGGRAPLLRHQRQGPHPAAGGDAGRPGQEPVRLRPDHQPRARARAPQRRARPAGPAQRDPSAQGRQAQEAAARAAPGQDAQRLPELQRAVLLRLRRELPRARPGARQDRRGPQEAALHRRPDDPHHDQPARPAGRRLLGAPPRLRQGPGHRRPGDGPARHRRREGHLPVASDGPRQEGRPDLPELRRAAEVRRLQRLPARLDVQGVRARGRDPAGHPAVRSGSSRRCR